MFEHWSDLDRRTVVFVNLYETTRRECSQHGYRAFTEAVTDETRSTTLFKQFAGVVTWLDAQGMSVSWNQVVWQGFLRHAFKYLSPTIPQPSQLKNKLLLWKYLESSNFTTDAEPLRTDDDLRTLYSRVLHKDVKDSPALMRQMGVLFRKEV